MLPLKRNVLIVALSVVTFSCASPTQEVVEEQPAPPRVEKYSETYDNGFVKLRGTLLDGKRSGRWESFYDNGMRWSEVQYVQGQRDGAVVSYYPNGMMRYQGQYAGGDRTGIWMFYDTTGVMIERIDMDEFKEHLDTLDIGLKAK